MNENQKNLLIRNGVLLLIVIILCAILSRWALRGETLEEYDKKNHSDTSDISDSVKEANLATAITLPDTNMVNVNECTSDVLSTEALSLYSTTNDNLLGENTIPHSEFSGDNAMNDRILYKEGFFYESLSESIKNRITGISYPADDTDALIHYDDLRYVSVQYYNFNGNVRVGDLICHKDIAQDLVEIFYELYLAQYPIERIRLIDEYSANDDLSMMDNNTSCFCYRFIANTTHLSNHSFGKAIDINPFFNPYVVPKNFGETLIYPSGSESYVDRTKPFAYKIDHDDLAYKLFTEHGFTWGGDWKNSKDYQHFEKNEGHESPQ